MKNYYFLVICLIFFSGCGKTILLKNGKPASDQVFQQERLICERQAASIYKYIPVLKTKPAVVSSPIRTTCSKSGTDFDCTSTGGERKSARIVTVDGNAGRRKNYIATCMKARGFSLKRVKNY